MTDRELLELAAKAAGVDHAKIDEDGMVEGYDVNGDPIIVKGWNPLTDDGDALRLAVARNMTIYFGETNAYADSSHGMSHEPFKNGDKAAALRRAIVRSASEDGKAML